MTAPAPDRAPDAPDDMRKAFEAADVEKMATELDARSWWITESVIVEDDYNGDTYMSSRRDPSDLPKQAAAMLRSQSAALAEKDDKIAQLRLISNVNGDWSLKYSQAIERAETAESALADARAEVERLRTTPADADDLTIALRRLTPKDSGYAELGRAAADAIAERDAEVARLRQIYTAHLERAERAEAALAAKERECEAAAKLILGDLPTPQDILDATNAYNAARTEVTIAAITQRAKE